MVPPDDLDQTGALGAREARVLAAQVPEHAVADVDVRDERAEFLPEKPVQGGGASRDVHDLARLAHRLLDEGDLDARGSDADQGETSIRRQDILQDESRQREPRNDERAVEGAAGDAREKLGGIGAARRRRAEHGPGRATLFARDGAEQPQEDGAFLLRGVSRRQGLDGRQTAPEDLLAEDVSVGSVRWREDGAVEPHLAGGGVAEAHARGGGAEVDAHAKRCRRLRHGSFLHDRSGRIPLSVGRRSPLTAAGRRGSRRLRRRTARIPRSARMSAREGGPPRRGRLQGILGATP